MAEDDGVRVVPQDEDALRELAVKRLHEKRDFKTHLVVYVLVNLLLIVIYVVAAAVSGAWFPWVVFPIFGWGIGLGVHAWSVYGRRDITEEEIAREIETMRRRG
jgi:hypothetical protein